MESQIDRRVGIHRSVSAKYVWVSGVRKNLASSQDSSGYFVPTGREADSTPDQVADVVLYGETDGAQLILGLSEDAVASRLVPNPDTWFIIATAPVAKGGVPREA